MIIASVKSNEYRGLHIFAQSNEQTDYKKVTIFTNPYGYLGFLMGGRNTV